MSSGEMLCQKGLGELSLDLEDLYSASGSIWGFASELERETHFSAQAQVAPEGEQPALSQVSAAQMNAYK